MNKRMRELLKKRAAIMAEVEALNAKAGDDGLLTEDQQKEFTALESKIKDIDTAYAREESIQQMSKALGADVAEAADGSGEDVKVLGDLKDKDPKGGWKSFGEFAAAIVSASKKQGGVVDERLSIGATDATTFGNTDSGVDGGYLVADDFRDEIFRPVMEELSLLSMTDSIPSNSDTLVLPVDETTPWDNANGIRVYWPSEAAAITQSKPVFKKFRTDLDKVTALVPISSELLMNAPGLDAYLRSKAPEKIGFSVDLKIISGIGVGEPLGILNSDALISVAKEGSQSADTVVAGNINKMYGRMYAPYRKDAVWLCNQDVEQQLEALAYTGTQTNAPIYRPVGENGNLSEFATLKNRPVIPHQAMKALGDKGDVIFADLKQYLSTVKSLGLRSDVSMHLWFDQDLMAFRFILHIGGQPWLSAPIDPLNGSSTLSSFVTLDERA